MPAPPLAPWDAAACLGQLARSRSASVSLAHSLARVQQPRRGALPGAIGIVSPRAIGAALFLCSGLSLVCLEPPMRSRLQTAAALCCSAQPAHRIAAPLCTALSFSALHRTALHCSGSALLLCCAAQMPIAHCAPLHLLSQLLLTALASHSHSALHRHSALHCTFPQCIAPYCAALLWLSAAPLLLSPDAHRSLRSTALAYTHPGCSTYWLLSI